MGKKKGKGEKPEKAAPQEQPSAMQQQPGAGPSSQGDSGQGRGRGQGRGEGGGRGRGQGRGGGGDQPTQMRQEAPGPKEYPQQYSQPQHQPSERGASGQSRGRGQGRGGGGDQPTQTRQEAQGPRESPQHQPSDRGSPGQARGRGQGQFRGRGQSTQPQQFSQPQAPWQPGPPQQQQGAWSQPSQPAPIFGPQYGQQMPGPRGPPTQPPQQFGQPQMTWQQPGPAAQVRMPQQQQGGWSQPVQAPPGMPPQQAFQPKEPIRQMPMQQPQVPVGFPQQPPQVFPQQQQPGEQRDVPASGPPQKQQPQKGQQKGQQKGPKRQEQTAGQTHEAPTAELSQMKISKTEAGQGDTKVLPMEFIRAKPGIKGRTIPIETNHLSLNVGKLKTAIHYDVNLDPDKPKKYLRTVMEQFRMQYYSDRYPAFDGRKNLYSSSPLPFGEFIQGEVVLREADGREKTYKVEVKYANHVDMTPLQDLLRSQATPREALQVVDIVLRSAPAAKCISVGRSFFTKPEVIIDLGEGMEMYSGFYQSAIRGWKPFLNVDVAHKAFPKSINLIDALLEVLGDYFNPFTRDNLSRPLERRDIDTINQFIKTLRVSYEIPGHPGTRRVYRVNGVDAPPKTTTFKLDSGETSTIEKYFETHKSYKLKYPNMPTLWVGSQNNPKKILLPLELCTLVPGQVVLRKMTENQTSKMIKYAATDTKTRKDKIMRSVGTAQHNAHPSVREFGFSVANQFEKLNARVLQPPSLMYAGERPVRPSKGVWRGERFFKGVTINKWTIVCVDRRAPRPDDLTRFAEQIFTCGAASGMTITSRAEKPFQTIRCQSPMDIKKFFQTMKEQKFEVIFVIVPNSGPQYSYVKTAAELNVGCLTQCIKSRTLGKMNQQTAVNILLKVNSKLNGTNHFLATRPSIMNRPIIIMGADVTHPSPDSRNIPSVAAVTASHDPKAFQYNICWRLQPPTVEIIEDLEAIVIEQLKYFEQKNRVKPERIIFFRDGVSEGQFDQVRSSEIRAIRSACKQLQRDGYEPAITFLVVQKRHHTRLFPLNPRDSEDRNSNVPAGTCVDTDITHPFMQDFYLVSHASIQGVAKPTKYCTLWDDNNLTNDDIEELTYFLCHMFTRCNRSVSYPAPTYYAHLAAARAKVYIENERLNLDQLPREYVRFQIQDVIRKDLPMFFV